MMELHKGLTVDAARYGNISRYINHSCDPNAASFVTKVFVKKTKEGSLYDTRSYIRAIRTIDDGDEITFSYNMNNEENLPDCECGAENCMGTMGKAKREKPEVADSSEKAAKKNKSSKKKSVKNQNRKSQEVPTFFLSFNILILFLIFRPERTEPHLRNQKFLLRNHPQAPRRALPSSNKHHGQFPRIRKI